MNPLWMLVLLAAALDQRRDPEIIILNPESDLILLDTPCSGNLNVAPGCGDRLISEHIANLCSDAKTSLRATNKLHLLPFFDSRTEPGRRPQPLYRGTGVVGAVGFEPTTSTV